MRKWNCTFYFFLNLYLGESIFRIIVQDKLNGYIRLTLNEQKFLNGIIRKIRPKKIIEIGVAYGGSSSIILNAIKNINGARLYSIDIRKIYGKDRKKVGFLVEEKFPNLMEKWRLFTGGIASEFIEKIGREIDIAFIDTAHMSPGEKLDLLQVLPFLKEEAIIIFHDTFLMFYGDIVKKKKKNYTNNQIICYLRGELILPNYGNSIFLRNIGAIKLYKNQKDYFLQYFLALGDMWDYMPKEKHILRMKCFFTKYYDLKYVNIFMDAVEKNAIHLNMTYN